MNAGRLRKMKSATVINAIVEASHIFCVSEKMSAIFFLQPAVTGLVVINLIHAGS